LIASDDMFEEVHFTSALNRFRLEMAETVLNNLTVVALSGSQLPR